MEELDYKQRPPRVHVPLTVICQAQRGLFAEVLRVPLTARKIIRKTLPATDSVGTLTDQFSGDFSMQMNPLRSLALAAVLMSGTSIGAFAQSAVDGAVGGIIHDPSGAVVPGAEITVTNNGTSAAQTVKADDQ